MSLTRRQFAAALFCAVLAGTGRFGSVCSAQQRYLNADVYKMELYALTEEQKAFIDIVISLAEEQAIPPSIVEKCFFYARKKSQKHRRYYYFKKALEFALNEKGYDLEKLMAKRR